MTHKAIKEVLAGGLEQAWAVLIADPKLQVEFLKWLSERFRRLWAGNPRMIAIAGYMKRAADDMELRQPAKKGEREFSKEELSSTELAGIEIAMTEETE